jgi:apolipoprotein N-acyltransferase
MTVSDRYGRILSEQASAPQAATLIARLPAATDQAAPIYARHGAWGDWLWIFAAALLLWRLRRARSGADGTGSRA